MFRFLATLIFALLCLIQVDGAFAFQKAVRLADTPNTGDSTNSGNAYQTEFYLVDCASPVQACVVLTGIGAGTVTFSLVGKVRISGDTWPAGSGTVTLVSRSVTQDGRYMLQVSPGQHDNASNTDGLLNDVALSVTSDNADSLKVNSYMIYQFPEQPE